MPRRELPESLRRGPFAVSDALGLGVSRGRLRSRDLVAPYYAVRVSHDATLDLRARCQAYAARMRPSHFFSHRTAAALFGIPLPGGSKDSPLDVCARLPGRAPEGRGVRGRQLTVDDRDLTTLWGVRATGATVTWCTLAQELGIEDLAAAGDYLVTPVGLGQPSVTTVLALEEAVRSRPGMRGRSRMLEALPLVRVGALSRPESLLRVILVRAGLPEPQINAKVMVDGRFVAMPDLSWPQHRVAIEYEGDYHRVERGQFHRDIARIESLVDAGWAVLRVSAPALFDDPRALAHLVSRRLASAGWTPRPLDLRQIAPLRR